MTTQNSAVFINAEAFFLSDDVKWVETVKDIYVLLHIVFQSSLSLACLVLLEPHNVP